jgi:NAD(P)-dependent dehydrogenase (short-subunit alcohol dehydrogenase family)
MSSRSADLADAAQAQAWIKDVMAEHGRIDIVYNNASAARFGSIPDFSVEDWRYTLRNELDLVFYVTKFAWPHLAVRGGVILNTASVAGHRRSGSGGNGGGVGGAAHATTKAGVIALTRAMASEGAPLKIRANSISPGYIITPGTAAMMENPAIREPLLKSIPLGRAGLPSDIITMALFLVSDDASYMTGADILVDGGLVNG